MPETASWQAVHDEVSRRIANRQWQPGDLIPGEVDLAREFGCARATVNRALQALADAGVLDRKRKAGTRVALNPVRKVTVEIPVTRVEVERRGAAYSHRLLARSRGTASAAMASQNGLEAGAPVLYVATLHEADGAPFAHEVRWVNLDAAPGIAEADLAAISANEWLVRHAPLSRGEFRFSAANAGREEAAVLAAEPGAAIFVIERRTWAGDRPITHVRLAHAPGFVMETAV